ncbi:MAG TPA: nucleotide sugar dehydrogenase [Candidatus Polarisedimenticolia bacterium]|nr:nucleotide sugar dehydrogenase [Candidatus Polarisedimenticolia bacterium]
MDGNGLKARIRDRKARVGIIGMGYVGLPLAVEFARAGFTVDGIDLDPRKVKAINGGRSYISDVSGGEVRELVSGGRLSATSGFEVLRRTDCAIICVPTPLRKTRDPDISYIVSALEEVAQRLHKGMLVILESTTYPGTTEEIMLPRLAETGLRPGKDFYLAFSPERVDPGNRSWHTKNTPKVVGGITSACGQMASLLYSQAVERVVPVSCARAAEMIKLLENTFRSVNIALVNEIALICDRLGLEVWEIIDGAATKPFGFMPFYPGPGLGGHCIPIDPHYLSWKLRTLDYQARFIELAAEINGGMPHHVLSKVVDTLNRQRKAVSGSRVLVLGVAYKRDTSDTRESPSLDVMKLLRERGARVDYHDPFVPTLPAGSAGPGPARRSVPLTASRLRGYDCAIIVTDHSGIDYQAVVDHSKAVVDTRNATRGVRRGRNKVTKL